MRKQSYASERSIAQVLSHVGNGAEIFLLNVNAGRADPAVIAVTTTGPARPANSRSTPAASP